MNPYGITDNRLHKADAERYGKSYTMRIGGVDYIFDYDASIPGWQVTDTADGSVIRLVGRSITTAKKSLREMVGE